MSDDATAETGVRRAPSRAERRKARKEARADKPARESSSGAPEAKKRAQLPLLLRCAHPKLSLLVAVAVGVLAFVDGRPLREAGVAAAATLLVWLLNGLLNDVFDALLDAKGGASGKPIAAGDVPAGNATFVALLLLILAVPVALENGTVAGVSLLGGVLVGYLHNRTLHRTVFSFLGWAVTFALVPAFLAYGGWGGGLHGSPPTWAMTGAAAALGICVHLLTTLPDLVVDNRAGQRSLPLRIALKIGATRLLVLSVLLTAAAIAGIVLVALGPGLRQ